MTIQFIYDMITIFSVEALQNNSTETIWGIDAAKLFIYLWNRKFKKYPINLMPKVDLYSRLCKIRMDNDLYEKARIRKKQFPDGLIVHVMRILLNWNKQLLNNKITNAQWKQIKTDAHINSDHPFLLEFE